METETVIEKMRLKPLGWGPSLLLFLIAASLLRVAHYYFAPAYTLATGSPYLIGYLIVWEGTMIMFFVASPIAYKVDGHPINKKEFVARYRLDRMKRADWIWTLAMIVFSAASLGALYFTTNWLKPISWFAPHPAFPADMVDITNLTPGVLFEMPLQGEWWLIGVYFIGWFLNI